MAIRRFYERAAETVFLPGDESDASELVIRIVNLAAGVDAILRQLEDDSREMSRRFAEHAAALARGRSPMTPPTSWSTIGDVAANSVRLEDRREALHDLIRVTHGLAALANFRGEVERQYAAESIVASKAAS